MVIRRRYTDEANFDRIEVAYDGPLEDDFRGAKLEAEANGGLTITIEQEDEFDNTIYTTIHLDQFDIQKLRSL